MTRYSVRFRACKETKRDQIATLLPKGASVPWLAQKMGNSKILPKDAFAITQLKLFLIQEWSVLSPKASDFDQLKQRYMTLVSGVYI